MRIFLDANILFSAAKSKGAVRQLLELLLEAGHDCFVDDFVLVEARRNLERKAGAEGPRSLADLERKLTRSTSRPAELVFPREPALPEKDRPVLAAAIHANCEVLLTGDRTHFGPLFGTVFQGVTIHSPQSLVESLWPGRRSGP